MKMEIGFWCAEHNRPLVCNPSEIGSFLAPNDLIISGDGGVASSDFFTINFEHAACRKAGRTCQDHWYVNIRTR